MTGYAAAFLRWRDRRVDGERLLLILFWMLPILAVCLSLSVTGLLAVLAVWALLLPTVRREAARLLREPAAWAVLAYLLWYAITTIWSPLPGEGLWLIARTVLVSLSGLVLLALLLSVDAPAAQRLLGVVAWSGLLFVALFVGGMVICNWLPNIGLPNFWHGDRVCTRTALWRAAPQLAILAVPFAVAVATRFGKVAAALLLAVAAVAVSLHDRDINFIALLLAALAFAAVLATGRVGARICGAAMALWILAAPTAIGVVHDGLRDRMPELPPSWQQRVYIWDQTLALIAEAPIAGKGNGFTEAFRDVRGPEVPIYHMGIVEPWVLSFLNPHSIPLHMRVETGIVGALLLAGSMLLLVWRLTPRTASRLQLAAGMAVLAGWIAVCSVGQSPTGTWWVTTTWVATLVTAAVLRGIAPPGHEAADA